MMKKTNYIFLSAMAIAFASCTSNGNEPEPIVPVEEDQAVEAFALADIEGATRMTGTAFANGDAIGITCTQTSAGAALANTDLMYNKFINCKYTLNSTKFTGADLANTIFFQNNGQYRFRAYYPYDGSKGAEPSSVVNTATKQDATTQNTSLDKLWADGATGSKAAPGIAFTSTNAFQHKMVKLILKITLDANSGFAGTTSSFFTSAHVFVNGLKHNGSFNTSNGTASVNANATANTNWEINSTAVAAKSSDLTSPGVGKQYELLILPQSATTVTFKVEESGVTYQGTASITPEAGKQITVPIVLKRTGLAVGTYTINDWGVGSAYTGDAGL